MKFTEKTYPVDKAIFDYIVQKRGTNKRQMCLQMGYSRYAISFALAEGHFSSRLAAAIYNSYSIAPNDYAPKVSGVNAPVPKPQNWQDFINADTDWKTLMDALEYIVGEIRLRTSAEE